MPHPNAITMTEWRTFTLPDPISTNKLYRETTPGERYYHWERFGRAMKGRTYTAAYKAWKDEAILAVRSQLRPMPHCPGPFFLNISVGAGVDIDNTVKCIADLLKAVGLIVDDKPSYMVDLHVQFAAGQPCTVAIRPVGEWA